MRVIGTAGHVDHGKSTLVQALTGTHPDRLKEEREREMTIDLGFAFFNLDDGTEIGVVDVPGHRDFIENMLSGVGGIDAALFVVAADEGVMPQTREHLAIIDLLQIDGGVVALTKTDLVNDPDWLDLVEEELRNELTGTVIEEAEIIRVSARTGNGVAEVKQAIQKLLAYRPAGRDWGDYRLPIDRVFSVAGFGTVVTGTLLDGSIVEGDEVEIAPSAVRGRIRGIQSHNRKEKTAFAGSRVAVNISGVSVDEVPRGNWLIAPGTYPITRRLDLQFQMLADASAPLKHNTEVKFFIGAAEVMGRVRVLGVEAILPGTSGWLQIELAEPVVSRRRDRYIIRRPSPGETIGGGEVVDPEPARRYKRFSDSVIQRLEALAGGSPEEIFLEAAKSCGISPIREITRVSGLSAEIVDGFLDTLFQSEKLLFIEPGDHRAEAATLAADWDTWQRVSNQIEHELFNYFEKNPLKPGMPRDELRGRLKLNVPLFNAVAEFKTEVWRQIDQRQGMIFNLVHEIRFSDGQQKHIDRLLDRFAAAPYGPPSVKECIAAVGEDVVEALIYLEKLVKVSPEVVFRKADYDGMVAAVKDMIAANGMITVGEFRDRFQTSRKYALGLLEHLDATGVTYRHGEGRKLKS